jgi:hypothetical protein
VFESTDHVKLPDPVAPRSGSAGPPGVVVLVPGTLDVDPLPGVLDVVEEVEEVVEVVVVEEVPSTVGEPSSVQAAAPRSTTARTERTDRRRTIGETIPSANLHYADRGNEAGALH